MKKMVLNIVQEQNVLIGDTAGNCFYIMNFLLNFMSMLK